MHVDGRVVLVRGFKQDHRVLVDKAFHAVIAVEPHDHYVPVDRRIGRIDHQHIPRIDAVANHAFPRSPHKIRGFGVDIAQVVEIEPTFDVALGRAGEAALHQREEKRNGIPVANGGLYNVEGVYAVVFVNHSGLDTCTNRYIIDLFYIIQLYYKKPDYLGVYG